MKVGILAGGQGTRLAEETAVRPKPMVEIGDEPILLHIMRHYAAYDHKEFVVALGYKGEYIKRYFLDLAALSRNCRIDLSDGAVDFHGGDRLDWIVELIDTGASTGTGGRIKRLAPYLGDGTFMLTWGDGVSNVDLDRLLSFHRAHGKIATVTSVRPPARFGYLDIQGDRITRFAEKPATAEGWINGAFFVLEPAVFDYIEGDEIMFEGAPLQRLAEDGELMAFRHEGFWQCMDTIRDKQLLQELWNNNRAPWKTWE